MPALCFSCGGDPRGACGICSVFACSRHGSRDPHAPRWECVLCTSGSVVKSAAQISGLQLAEYGIAAVPGEPVEAYKHIANFLDRRPDYGWMKEHVAVVVDRANGRFDGNRLWNQLTPDGQGLVAMAIFLVSERAVPEAQLTGAMKELWMLWNV